MFKSQNFCHIASNNRNQVKVGVFVYRTTDSLATVLTSGYFNDRIIDINLHDLIIHEKVDSVDATKVERNLLCVTGRTLENVSTSIIKSKWEGDIEQAIADLQTYIDNNFVKLDGTSVMTAPLKFAAGSMRGAVGPYLNGVSFWKLDSQGNITNIANLTDSQFTPVTTNSINLGNTTHTWKDAYVARVITSVLNNGYDIAVPVTNSPDTFALKSEVDLAANSGRMITDQGVWYAKMYAATVAPAADDDTNYADFSQTDGQGNPIIVIYERQSGAWVQSETITPPAEYDGYVPITSKIWDIPEQAGQQGGRILWNHQSKEFTPYPQIISFENINVTGVSTVAMPANPESTQITNKDYVDNAISSAIAEASDFDLFDFKWRDSTTSNTRWALSDGNWKTNSKAYQELFDDIYLSQRWIGGSGYEYFYVYTASQIPEIGDDVYSDANLTTSIGTITAYDSQTQRITYNNLSYLVNDIQFVTPIYDPTYPSYPLTIYVGRSGKKILFTGSESSANYIYGLTGVAWYYILDTANQRFKLPRVNPDRKKIILEAPTVGATPASLPSGTSSATNLVGKDLALQYSFSGGLAYTHMNDANDSSNVQAQPTEIALVTDFTNSTSYYAGEQYLYFYIGTTV